ncbi:MAG: YitT family protein [Erysipelotrichaceae bacterium]|nr:YitT family protein [Erysipelotrichaceae bacterium]
MELSKFGKELWFDVIGGFLIGISVHVFASSADFAPGGVNGLALISQHLFGFRIGLVTLILNIPIIIFSYKYLGKNFLFKSLKTMAIFAFMMDYVVPLIPVYHGNQLLASIFTGIIGGIGYALIYMQGSSTGGSDFFIMSVKKLFPHHSIGFITQVSDAVVILLGMFVFKNIEAVLYGLIAVAVGSIVVDKIMYGANSGKIVFIVSSKSEEIAEAINQVVQRGSTFLHATGSYSKKEGNVIFCACSRNQVYVIKSVVESIDDSSIMIICESNEVYGHGFQELKNT